jgi:hypothetical protein
VSRGRIEKTLERVRRGRLPAATVHAWILRPGDGRPCDGCGEEIAVGDVRVSVNVADAFNGHFHELCYDAWVTFRRGT